MQDEPGKIKIIQQQMRRLRHKRLQDQKQIKEWEEIGKKRNQRVRELKLQLE
jgi:hypothetical protein